MVPFSERITINRQQVGDRVDYFVQWRKERRPMSRDDAEAMAARGEATIRKMRPGNRTTGPKPYLLSEVFKTAGRADTIAGAMTEHDEHYVFAAVRCLDGKADTEAFDPARKYRGDYTWRLRKVPR